MINPYFYTDWTKSGTIIMRTMPPNNLTPKQEKGNTINEIERKKKCIDILKRQKEDQKNKKEVRVNYNTDIVTKLEAEVKYLENKLESLG